MSINHSEETHRNLVARIPSATGRNLNDWSQVLSDGPAFHRFQDRVTWLRDEFNLPRSYASAIVHELDLKRAARAFS